MGKVESFGGISVSHDGTKIVDSKTGQEYALRPGEEIIDKNVIGEDGKIKSKIIGGLVEGMSHDVRNLLTLEEYVQARNEE